MTDPVADTIRRIVVLRANGLGDFLFATPALRALARYFSSAEITYLCLPWLRPFIAGRYPYLHRVLTVPPYPGIRQVEGDPAVAAREREEFFAASQAYGYDLAIQMHGGGVESNPFVRRLGARHTLGLAGRGVAPLEHHLRYEFYQSEVMRYLELVARIGVPPAGVEMDAPELPDDEVRLRTAWADAGRGPYAVIHPGASDPRRRWPIERFAAVADHLWRFHGLPGVVTGSLAERPMASQLQRLAAAPLHNLSGWLDLGAVLALVRRARLVVSNDTGVAHLAHAAGVPSVVIYWCGNLITAAPFTRARYRPVLSWTVDCPRCGARRCRCPVSFVAEAPLREVLDQIDDLLSAAPDRAW
ncbi:MAG: glycosyltransferase family 9 protein [Chloroflexi bacterium]|nr:glycosyltransferase family 9 protein [Chloroflexota bacterium]